MSLKSFMARVLFALAAVSVATPITLAEPLRSLRVGYVVNGPEHSVFEEQFELGLRDNGYVPGHNILIDYRYAPMSTGHLDGIMKAFVQAKMDAIFVSTRHAALTAKAATSTIPIIFGAARDAVEDGLVKSLARPEANLTGQSFHIGDLSTKRIQLLRDAFPGFGKFGVLWSARHPGWPGAFMAEDARKAEMALGIELVLKAVEAPGGLEQAISELKSEGVVASVLVADGTTVANRVAIGDLAVLHQMALMMSNRAFLAGGALMSYGPDVSKGFRRAARQLVRAANGTPVAELPVEQPTRFEFIIDFGAARQLGVDLPVSILSRADEVID